MLKLLSWIEILSYLLCQILLNSEEDISENAPSGAAVAVGITVRCLMVIFLLVNGWVESFKVQTDLLVYFLVPM